MSELTLVLIKFAYLAILWIFVLSAVSVVRSDLFGARVPTSSRSQERRPDPGRGGARPGRPRKRGAPTHLVVVEGDDSGARASLEDAPLLIGRGPDAAIRLEDDYVSTRHARVGRSGDQWFVEDLGSTNGTYVDNRRITTPTTIAPGTQVRTGKTILELRK